MEERAERAATLCSSWMELVSEDPLLTNIDILMASNMIATAWVNGGDKHNKESMQ